jgi:hypothetical protein
MADFETISNENFFTVVVDPNGLNKENVRHEDLFIFVDFRALPKSRSVVETDGTISNDVFDSKGISFISTSTQNGKEYVTTNYTNIGGNQRQEKEAFGITEIKIEFGKDLAPLVNIKFVDVRGAGLLNGYETVDENGVLSNNSYFSTFFSMPYPVFQLTVKGYYGKAVTYCLNLMKWNMTFNAEKGDFEIDATFQGYTFAFLADVLMKHVIAITTSDVGQEALKKEGVISISELVGRLGQLTRISEDFKKGSASYEELKFVNSLLLDRIDRVIDVIGLPMNKSNYSTFGNKLPIPQLKINVDQIFIRDVGVISEEKSVEIKAIIEDVDKYIKEYNDFIKTNLAKYSYANQYKIDNFNINIPAISYLINDASTKKIISEALKDGLSDSADITTTGALRSRLGLTEDSQKKFFIIDFHPFRLELTEIKEELTKKKNELEKLVNEELNANIESQLGLKLNIQSVFDILAGNVDAYLKVIYDYAKAADNPDIQKERVKAIRGGKSDIGEDVNRVFPFPAVFDSKEDKEVWIGDIVGEDNPYFPEIDLVRKTLNSIVTSNGKTASDNLNANAKNIVGISGDSWIPLNPKDYSPIPYDTINKLSFNGNQIPVELANEIVKRATNAYNKTGDREAVFNYIAQFEGAFAFNKTTESIIKDIINNTDSNNFADSVINSATLGTDVTLGNTTVTKNTQVQTTNNTTITTTTTQTVTVIETVEPVLVLPDDYIKYIASFETAYGYPNYGLNASDPNGTYGTSYPNNKFPNNFSLNDAINIYNSAFYTPFLSNTPEGLKPILLDICVNQVDPLGMLLATANRLNPAIPTPLTLIRAKWFGEGVYNSNPQNAIPFPSQYNTTTSYNDFQVFKPAIDTLYNANPKAFINELTKVRLMYYSLNANREKTSRNKITFFNEWSIRALAMAQFSKDIRENKQQQYSYYHGANAEFVKRGNNFSFELKSGKDAQNNLVWFNQVASFATPYLSDVNPDLNTNKNVNTTVPITDVNKIVLLGTNGNTDDDKEILNFYKQKKRDLSSVVNNIITESKVSIEDILIPTKFKDVHRSLDKKTYVVKGDITDLIWKDDVKASIRKFHKSKTSNDLLPDKSYANIISFEINDLAVFDGQRNPIVDFVNNPDLNSKYTNLLRKYIGLGFIKGVDSDKLLFNQYYYVNANSLEKAYMFLLTLPIDNISDFYRILNLGGIYKMTKIQLAWVGAQFWRAKLIRDTKNDVFDSVLLKIADLVGTNSTELSPNQIQIYLNGLFDLQNSKLSYLPNLEDFSEVFIQKLSKYFEDWAFNDYFISNEAVLSDFNTTNSRLEEFVLNYHNLFFLSAELPSSTNHEQFKFYYDKVLQSLITPVDIHINDINAIKRTLKNEDILSQEVLKQYLVRWINTYKALVVANKNTVNADNNRGIASGTESFYTADKDTKIAAYRHFKNLYDKWIGGTLDGRVYNSCSNTGSALSGKRLIDRFHFVDSAFNPVGDTAVVDPKTLMKLSSESSENFAIFISSLGRQSGFEMHALPSFVHYKTPQEALDMWKPYTTAQDANSGASYICMYRGGNSKNLDLGKKSYYVNDGFDFREADYRNIPDAFKKRVPLNANNVPTDRDKYNLVIFRVGYADQNQSIFKTITLNQSEHKETEEYLKAYSDTFDARGGTKPFYKKVNLYNLFAIRSYKCSVSCMGNMMVHALNYFQLDNIPFFHGAYQVAKVSHSISAHDVQTTFEGYRMPRFTYPVVKSITSYITIPLSETLFSGEEKTKAIIRPLGGKSYSEAEISSSKENASDVSTYNVGDNTTNSASVSTVAFTPFAGTLMDISGLAVNPISPSNLISSANSLNRNNRSLWFSSILAQYVLVTDAEVRQIMTKTRATGSTSLLTMLNNQSVDYGKLGVLDKYIKEKGEKAYVVGKARVARNLGTSQSMNKVFGFIDVSKVPENESATDSQRTAFANKYIKKFILPYKVRVTINSKGTLSSERDSLLLHKDVGDSLVYAMKEVLDFYGIDLIKKLGLNICDGAFVFRKQRNSSYVSTHAYGVAVDFLGAANAYSWNKNNSLFGESPYTAFLDIMEKWGWYNNGRWAGQDWMHFQAVHYSTSQKDYFA